MFKTLQIAALSLALAGPVLAGPPLTADQALGLMSKPGSWIEADGDFQRDGSLIAKDVEIYSPADSSELEGAAIYGAATGLDAGKSTLRVLGYVVTFDKDTTIKDERKQPTTI